MESDGERQLFCPTFSSYIAGELAQTAARVANELGSGANTGAADSEGDDDFEFDLVQSDFVFTAPVLDRDLVMHGDQNSHSAETDVLQLRVPLKNLFIEDPLDDGDRPSSTSSEADDLEAVVPGSYCVWWPKAVEAPPSRCKKSKSTGSASKRWKFRDLLRRSHSDGKGGLVFLTPNRAESSDSKEARGSGGAARKSKAKGGSPAGVKLSAVEAFYVQNRASKEGDKRKPYLPYRKELLGFFANAKGLRRSSTAS